MFDRTGSRGYVFGAFGSREEDTEPTVNIFTPNATATLLKGCDFLACRGKCHAYSVAAAFLVLGRRPSFLFLILTVSYLVAHFEVCFLCPFSDFQKQPEPVMLDSIFLE